MAEAGSDMGLAVAAGTNWKTEIEGKKHMQDFTFKHRFLSNTNVNNAM